ncbi:hypothetical protein NQZ68_033902 [Dissostichus eleginoides]|uniref:Membrane-spanning 4-domains subfamily A member 4A n=1 Tax=Dissostichus eleginoides TaxID=100907 RepID=A0AAD9BX03_DISEL|nr:hypothetical protein NQZ68_033902 [Dissostichus eleginoides]KAK1890582.1 Membrane-spanning 4-domains subfamily A member 4A [Dissostichus eleginoides]
MEVKVDTRTMAEEASVVEEGLPPSQTPLLSVSFERNVNWKQKYLEAEPKALGITQIGLSLFQIISSLVFMSKSLSVTPTDIPVIILSLLVLIAGSLTVAAQNLHLPTLRACLGMQIVAVTASIANMIIALVKMNDIPYFCRQYYYYEKNSTTGVYCHNLEGTISHLSSECVVINVALVTISITVAAYCCKVTNCCSPAPKMPVITVQAPPAQL